MHRDASQIVTRRDSRTRDKWSGELGRARGLGLEDGITLLGVGESFDGSSHESNGDADLSQYGLCPAQERSIPRRHESRVNGGVAGALEHELSTAWRVSVQMLARLVAIVADCATDY